MNIAIAFRWIAQASTDDKLTLVTVNISRTLVDNKIVDHSAVVEASPVGAAPTTSSFSN